MNYQENPSRAASYYVHLGNLYLSTRKSQTSLQNTNNYILSELAQNNVRQLFTPSMIETLFDPFPEEYRSTLSAKEKIGFSRLLLSNMQAFNILQGSRLGRFYFMYNYLLLLGMLESYEQILVHRPYINEQELHQKARMQMKNLVQTVQRLFYTQYCHLPHIFNRYFYPIEIDEQGERVVTPFKDGEQRHQHFKKTQEKVYELCPQGVHSNRGKLQILYANQNKLINDKNSYIYNNDIANVIPSLRDMGLEFLKNHKQEYRQNIELDEDIRMVQNMIQGTPNIHLHTFGLFQDLFPFSTDVKQMIKWLKAHQQLFVDIIPKLLLMYSEDRYFVGEMMWIISQIYNSCMYGRKQSLCQLQIERLMSYYFSHTLYGTNPNLERAFQLYTTNRKKLVNGGMSLSELINIKSNYVIDREINNDVFEPSALIDYLFYERKWDPLANRPEELEAQKTLLFQFLPLTSTQVVDTSLFYNALSR